MHRPSNAARLSPPAVNMSADSDEGQAKKVPAATILEPEQRDVRRIAGEADDQVQVIGIARYGSIRRRRDRRRSGMRVIEADDVQPAAARISPAVEVILWIDQKPRRRLVRDIPRPEGLEDRRIAAEQQPAAFGWNGFPRVGDDLSQD